MVETAARVVADAPVVSKRRWFTLVRIETLISASPANKKTPYL
jgi:hypothetical protein